MSVHCTGLHTLTPHSQTHHKHSRMHHNTKQNRRAFGRERDRGEGARGVRAGRQYGDRLTTSHSHAVGRQTDTLAARQTGR